MQIIAVKPSIIEIDDHGSPPAQQRGLNPSREPGQRLPLQPDQIISLPPEQKPEPPGIGPDDRPIRNPTPIQPLNIVIAEQGFDDELPAPALKIVKVLIAADPAA